jgi:hypothetical protein
MCALSLLIQKPEFSLTIEEKGCVYSDVIYPCNLSPTLSALDSSKKQTLPLNNKLCTELMSFLSPALKSWQMWQ